MKTYNIEELKPFFVGQGTERICFRSPSDPSSIIKLSPKSKSKQTIREIEYFRFLQKNNVPFVYIPLFKGEVNVAGYIGFEQEAVLDWDGTVSLPLGEYLKQHPGKYLKEEMLNLFGNLYYYMYYYNILPCDLNLNNIVVRRTDKKIDLFLVDGVGNSNLIGIEQYCKTFGRRKIKRKWKRFAENAIYKFIKD